MQAGAPTTGISTEPAVPGVSLWNRVREVIVTVTAVLPGLGVLIAGITYAAQPVREDIHALREDVRVLQGTSADVRERLARLEEGQAKLEEGQAKLEARQARLEEGQIRILTLLEHGRVPGTSR